MKTIFKNRSIRFGLGAAAVASVLLATAPASAHDRYPDRGNDVAIAIGAGILGLAVGAALADRDDRYYYDRRWYPARRYVTLRDRPGYYYYYEGQPRRYYRDRYYDRYYAPYYREQRRDWRSGRRDYRQDYRRDYRDGRHHEHYKYRGHRHHD